MFSIIIISSSRINILLNIWNLQPVQHSIPSTYQIRNILLEFYYPISTPPLIPNEILTHSDVFIAQLGRCVHSDWSCRCYCHAGTYALYCTVLYCTCCTYRIIYWYLNCIDSCVVLCCTVLYMLYRQNVLFSFFMLIFRWCESFFIAIFVFH